MRRFALVTLTLLFALTVLNPPLAEAQSTKAQPPAKAEQKAAPAPAAQPAAKTEPLDINSASVDELKTFPGIGDAYSKKIVEGRPYKRKDELVQKKIVLQATDDKIKEQIVAKQPPAKK